MSDDVKTPRKKVTDAERASATPAQEREPGEHAKPSNKVAAADAFGKPRMDAEWTREAIVTNTRKPSFGGADDRVKSELSKDYKG